MLKWIVAGFALAAAPFAHAENRETNPALFVVRDDDSTMYLFGTIHVLPRGASWGGANARAALAEAEEVWTETEIDPDIPSAVVALTFSDRSLASRLTSEQNARLGAALKRLGMERNALDRMQPWFAGTMMELIPFLQAGYDLEAGADYQIEAAAEAAGKRLRWFANEEEHTRILADLDERLQIALLMEAVESLDEGPAKEQAIETAWARGDMEALEALDTTERRNMNPELYDALLTRRNRAWVEMLVNELRGSGVDFVAVGAAHLIGEEGLVAQLRARGYRVERAPAH